MLWRVSCKSCNISSLWTDDPKGFLETVCLRYRHCEANLINEAFEQPLVVGRAKAVAARRGSSGKAASRAHGRDVPPPQ